MPTFLRREPAVERIDVVRVGDGLAEDDGHEVAAQMGLDRAAGRGARDEVERATELAPASTDRQSCVFARE